MLKATNLSIFYFLGTFFLLLAFLTNCLLSITISLINSNDKKVSLSYYFCFSQWCGGFELGTDACVDHAGQADQCSCVEVTNGSVYLFRVNLTARTQREQSVWLGWPGPPPIMSKIHILPKVKGCFDNIHSHTDFFFYI